MPTKAQVNEDSEKNNLVSDPMIKSLLSKINEKGELDFANSGL